MENISDRIKQILAYYNFTAGDLAKKLEVQKSSISHLLSGRNKPSFSFLNKLTLSFPEINLRWFLTGEGEMLVGDEKATNSPSAPVEKEINLIENSQSQEEKKKKIIAQSEKITEERDKTEKLENKIKQKQEQEVNSIVMIFDNDTFKILKRNKS